MLNEIVRARQNITTYMDITQKIRDPKGASREIRYRRIHELERSSPEIRNYRRLHFAVDIEPSAVDAAQLRLWLALVVMMINPTATSPIDGHRNPYRYPTWNAISFVVIVCDEFEDVSSLTTRYQQPFNGRQIDMFQSAFDAALERDCHRRSFSDVRKAAKRRFYSAKLRNYATYYHDSWRVLEMM